MSSPKYAQVSAETHGMYNHAPFLKALQYLGAAMERGFEFVMQVAVKFISYPLHM